jgi:hypothetical protein
VGGHVNDAGSAFAKLLQELVRTDHAADSLAEEGNGALSLKWCSVAVTPVKKATCDRSQVAKMWRREDTN